MHEPEPGATAPATASDSSAPTAAAKSGQDRAEPVAPKPHTSGSKAGEPAAEAKWVVAANVVPVAERGNEYFAVKGHQSGLRKDMLVQVVGPPQANGKRKLLGQAKVVRKMVVGPGMLLELSDSALTAKERRFVVVPGGRATPEPEPVAEAPQPEAPSAPPPAPEPPPAPAGPKALNIGVRQKGMISKEFEISNRETSVLSRCKAVLHDKRTADIKSLKIGFTTVDMGLFKKQWVAPPVGDGHILIECAEGKAEVEVVGL